jgi:2-acylglycerol O-acyltransferase 2
MAIIPGGFEEATLSSYDVDRVYLRKRKGWVKYALQHGYALTPIYCFGENQTFYNAQWFLDFRVWIATFGIPSVLPFGKPWLPFIPMNENLHIVVGKPLQLPTLDHPPTREEVTLWHGKYMKHLQTLYETHKNTDRGDRVLEIR